MQDLASTFWAFLARAPKLELQTSDVTLSTGLLA